jgi:phage FluMu protein Com
VSAPVPVRCTNYRPGGYPCGKKLASGFAGFLRTECPRCKQPLVAVTPGRIEIEDADGTIVVTVTKEPKRE